MPAGFIGRLSSAGRADIEVTSIFPPLNMPSKPCAGASTGNIFIPLATSSRAKRFLLKS
jgi:hypothetical protein